MLFNGPTVQQGNRFCRPLRILSYGVGKVPAIGHIADAVTAAFALVCNSYTGGRSAVGSLILLSARL
jgi:hypothetical protein